MMKKRVLKLADLQFTEGKLSRIHQLLDYTLGRIVVRPWNGVERPTFPIIVHRRVYIRSPDLDVIYSSRGKARLGGHSSRLRRDGRVRDKVSWRSLQEGRKETLKR